jgi:outer membrane protein OmpA-like peptidoglycan-associated protein
MKFAISILAAFTFGVSTTPAVGSIPNTYLVLFEHGSATISSTTIFQASLDAAVTEAKEALSRTDDIVVYVSGYADTSGPEDFNMQLSKRRAEAVANALIVAGIGREHLEISWHGESELPVPTPDGVREQANRSVLVSVWGKPLP